MAVQPVIMPKLGAYTEDVLLTEWLVDEGEEVAAGAVVLEMETEKTTAEVEAETSGWLHRLVSVGEKVPIGASVALIAETREEYEAVSRASAGTDEPRTAGDVSVEEDNPFLGYIGQGGGTAVARTAVAGGSAPGNSRS